MAAAKQRPKGEGSIYQRKDGLWCTSIELPRGDDDKRRRKVICRKDKGEVRQELRRLQQEIAERGALTEGGVTVEAWLDYWLEYIVAPHARPKTYAGYRSAAKHITAAIGKVKLDKLTPEHVRRVQLRVMSTPKGKSGETLSSAYAGNVHAVLKIALNAAVNEQKIVHNVADKVKPPASDSKERKALTVEQAITLLSYLAGHPQGALWACYLLTGARRGEILGLEADRVTDQLDLSWQLQRISNIAKAPNGFEYREVGSKLYLTRPKSKAGWRIVPLVEPLKTILNRYIDATGKTGLLFTREDGTPYNPDEITEAWAELLAAAELPDDIVLHGSRHTTVDLLYEAGVPEAVIMEIVGHTTRAVTRGYKSRGNRRQLEEAMTKMSALLSKPTE